MSDDALFSMSNASGFSGGGQPSPDDNMGAAVTGTASMLQETGARAKSAAEADSIESTYNAKTHTWSLDNVPHDALQTILKNAKEFGHITQLYQQKIAESERQQDYIKSHPFANALSQIAASVGATSKDPLVRGLGLAATRLNPTLQELQGQEMGLMRGAESAGEHQTAIADRLLYHQQLTQQKTEAQRQHQLALEEKGRVQVEKDSKDFVDPFKVRSEHGEKPPEFDKFAKTFGERVPGATYAQIKSEHERLTAVAEGFNKEEEQRRKDKIADRVAEGTQLARAMSPILEARKAEDKKEADKAIEETAQALAPMNKDSLNTMTQVAGMFGSARNKIFARARELNPHFNTAELGRMMETEKSFTSGKDSQGIQSFDTFLQHAGEVSETLKNISLTNTPLLNKSLNWWRKNMKGTPELARLETSLEPVGKEFESFLINQRALYIDDRKIIKELLNADQPLSVTMATLGQMGKTAKDRYGAMNHRYKRVMKQDIEDPFSEEGRVGAYKIGIDLPGATTTQKRPWE